MRFNWPALLVVTALGLGLVAVLIARDDPLVAMWVAIFVVGVGVATLRR